MIEKKNYPGMFDLFKGYAMVVILFAHTHGAVPVNVMMGENPTVPVRIFFAFERILSLFQGMMPLFFMISGYGFSPASMKKCIKKQTRVLLKPYLLTTLFVTIVHFFSQCVATANLKESVLRAAQVCLSYLLGISQRTAFHGIQFSFIGSVWFLLTLYFSWILLNAINLYVQERFRPLAVLMLALAGYLWGNRGVIPFCLPQALIGVGYMYVGQQLKKNDWLFKKIPIPAWCVIVLFAGISIFFGEIDMAYRIWKLGLLDIIGGGCSAFLLARGSLLLNKYENKILDTLRSIGLYSLWIMCIHSVESVGLLWRRYASRYYDHPFIAFFAVFILRSCIVYCLYRIVKKCSWSLRKRKRRLKQIARQG